MSRNQKLSLTQRYHSGLWWVTLVFFLFLSLEQFFPGLLGAEFPLFGVLFIIIATVVRAVVLAVDFRNTGQTKNQWLSLSLILLIGLAVLAGFLT